MELSRDQQRVNLQKMLAEGESRERMVRENADERVSIERRVGEDADEGECRRG